jgi:transcriptional regulator with XRE-family HTH domain
MEEKNFWKRISLRMKERAVTRKDLTRACGLNPNTLRGWIAKDTIPPTEDSCRIARFLGASVEYLLTGKHPPAALRIREIDALLKRASEKLDALVMDMDTICLKNG